LAPEPVPTDEELMTLVQQAEPAVAAAAYQQLYARHQARVYGFLVRRVRDPELAADLFQETFLSVYRARHTWQDGRRFRPWLFSIAANAGRDQGRRARRTPELDAFDERSAVHHDRPGPRLDLERAIGALPETLRDAFLLGAVEGMDHNEVGEALSISPDNARARLSRARAWLRDRLEGRG
jgi:RNA polymerase sigma factor (sigma-70 family)